jgi:hypothetical protein
MKTRSTEVRRTWQFPIFRLGKNNAILAGRRVLIRVSEFERLVKLADISGPKVVRKGSPNDDVGRLIYHFLVHFLDFRASGSVWTGYAFGKPLMGHLGMATGRLR